MTPRAARAESAGVGYSALTTSLTPTSSSRWSTMCGFIPLVAANVESRFIPFVATKVASSWELVGSGTSSGAQKLSR